MPPSEQILLLDLGEATTAPTEILMFAAGVTSTTKGPVVYDIEAGVQVAEAYAKRGLDRLPIDVAHGMLDYGGGPEQHKAFGWFVPRAAEDGLYASDVQWTDEGRALVESRAFRFVSPAVMLDADSGRVVEVINLALTNLPATNNQRPLVAERDIMKEQIIRVLSLAADASDDDVLAAIAAKDARILELEARAELSRRDAACEQLGLKGDWLAFARDLSAAAFDRFAALHAAQRVALSQRIEEPPRDREAPQYTEQQLKIAKQLQRAPAACFPTAGKEHE